MGDHRQNPKAIAKANGMHVPGFEFALDADVKTTLQPKPSLVVMPADGEIIEADGKRFVKTEGQVATEPLPEGALVARVGDEMKEEYLDVVISLRLIYTRGSLIAVDKLPQVVMPIVELARLDYVAVKAKVEGILAQAGKPIVQ